MTVQGRQVLDRQSPSGCRPRGGAVGLDGLAPWPGAIHQEGCGANPSRCFLTIRWLVTHESNQVVAWKGPFGRVLRHDVLGFTLHPRGREQASAELLESVRVSGTLHNTVSSSRPMRIGRAIERSRTLTDLEESGPGRPRVARRRDREPVATSSPRIGFASLPRDAEARSAWSSS